MLFFQFSRSFDMTSQIKADLATVFSFCICVLPYLISTPGVLIESGTTGVGVHFLARLKDKMWMCLCRFTSLQTVFTVVTEAVFDNPSALGHVPVCFLIGIFH